MSVSFETQKERKQYGARLAKTLDLYPDELYGLLTGLYNDGSSSETIDQWIKENLK